MTGQNVGDRIFFDLSARVKLRVTGTDRVRFLNGQITNDIRKATDTTAVEACVLNAKGKMDAHVFVHTDGDSFLIDADAALESSLQPRLERYIIADDVQMEDVTAQLSIFHIIGPTGQSLGRQRVMSVDRFGRSGHDIWCESHRRDEIKAELSQDFRFCDEGCAEPFRIKQGIPRWGCELTAEIIAELSQDFRFCDEGCAEPFRIKQGIPRWGCELTAEIIPVEANLEQRCIDYEKGCYIGQETISRMKMSGQRNKRLCGLISADGSKLIPETRLLGGPERKDAGWITSATRSGDREIALGYVKRGFNSGQEHLEAGSGETGSVAIRVVELPF